METIVVGVDGSPSADEALRFAAREAKLRGARLRLVSVWHIPAVAYGGMGVTMLDSDTEYEEEANQVLGAAIGRFADELAGIEVQRVVREGRAASGLVDESREAALLVVGSRGHGGFVGLLIGSVSNECAHHSACPVVIVRAKESKQA
jgi:nucleotide-binding universal stress UspA family protein